MNKHKHTRLSDNSGRRLSCFVAHSRASISFCRLKRSHTSGGRRGIFPFVYSQCISERFISNDGSFPWWRRRNLHPVSSQSLIKFKKWKHEKQMNRWQMRGNIFREKAVNKSKGCVCLCSVIFCYSEVKIIRFVCVFWNYFEGKVWRSHCEAVTLHSKYSESIWHT